MDEFTGEMSPEEMVDEVEKHVSQLREHFDTVQIFVTKFDPSDNTTDYVKLGNGNMFARLHQAEQFVEEDKIRDRLRLVKEIREEDNDEED